MNAYDLALETIQEGRIRASLCDLTEKYRQEEEFELYLLKQEKDAQMFNKLKKDLEESGYSLDVSNRCIKFVEEQVNYQTSQVNTEDEVFRIVDISTNKYIDDDNGVLRTIVYMTFETKDGRFFDIEMTQENELKRETEEGFFGSGFYAGERTFIDIELKK